MYDLCTRLLIDVNHRAVSQARPYPETLVGLLSIAAGLHQRAHTEISEGRSLCSLSVARAFARCSVAVTRGRDRAPVARVWSLPHEHISWTPGLESWVWGGHSGVAYGSSLFTRPTATHENYQRSLPKASTTEKDTGVRPQARVCRGSWGRWGHMVSYS